MTALLGLVLGHAGGRGVARCCRPRDIHIRATQVVELTTLAPSLAPSAHAKNGVPLRS